MEVLAATIHKYQNNQIYTAQHAWVVEVKVAIEK